MYRAERPRHSIVVSIRVPETVLRVKRTARAVSVGVARLVAQNADPA